jgi:hypothetical protein
VGQFAELEEISVRAGVRGGPGGTRTSNQTVMSEPRDREKPVNSDETEDV